MAFLKDVCPKPAKSPQKALDSYDLGSSGDGLFKDSYLELDKDEILNKDEYPTNSNA